MPFDFNAFLGYEIFSNTGRDYLTALVLSLAGIAFLKLFKGVVLMKVKKAAAVTRTEVDDILVKILHDIHWPLYFVISAYIAMRTLALPAAVSKVFHYALIIGIIYYATRVVQDIVDFTAEKLIRRREKNGGAQEASVIRSFVRIAKWLLWLVAILLVVSNLGFNVTTLVAGLGIGGLAIAFAFQKILEDIFSSISIYFDKPFEIGDFIIVGEHMGVVKNVGIKSTRIQALQGEEIVISNRELTSTRIQNFKKMMKRRVAFKFGVVYGTSNAKLKRALEIVRDVVKKAKLAELDRVHFKEFGNFSLDFEVVYYLGSREYNDYMDTQQEINLGIKELFEREKIEFAYPTQTIVLSKLVSDISIL